jgi:hypothetical protein
MGHKRIDNSSQFNTENGSCDQNEVSTMDTKRCDLHHSRRIPTERYLGQASSEKILSRLSTGTSEKTLLPWPQTSAAPYFILSLFLKGGGMVLQVPTSLPVKNHVCGMKAQPLAPARITGAGAPEKSATSMTCSVIVAEGGSHQFQGGIYGGSIYLQLR